MCQLQCSKLSGICWPSSSADEDLEDLDPSCFSHCHLLYQINCEMSWQLGLSPTNMPIELQEELAYLFSLVFLPLWQNLASCPNWNLSLDTTNAPWIFVEMLKGLWLLAHLHHHDPSALAAGASGAPQRSHSPGAVHLQCSFWLCLQNCPVFACSNINPNAPWHRWAVYLIIPRLTQSLQGWWGSSRAWQCQGMSDVCTGTGSQLRGVLVFFHSPRQDLRLLPEQGHICLQATLIQTGVFWGERKVHSRRAKKSTSKWRQATILLQELLKKKINTSSYLNSWSQQAAML